MVQVFEELEVSIRLNHMKLLQLSHLWPAKWTFHKVQPNISVESEQETGREGMGRLFLAERGWTVQGERQLQQREENVQPHVIKIGLESEQRSECSQCPSPRLFHIVELLFGGKIIFRDLPSFHLKQRWAGAVVYSLSLGGCENTSE